MSYDEIQTSRKKDGLIAKHVMKLKIAAGRKMDALIAKRVMKLKISCKCENPCRCGNRLPNYSTDIASAWAVVEKLAKPLKVVWTGRVWVCEVFEEPYSEEADTAPLAICRAALEAVEA